MSEMNSRLPTREVSISLTLRDLATPLFRCKRVLIVTFLFVFATAALLGLLYLHKYESHIVILVSRERLDPVATSEAANRTGAPPALTAWELNSDAELIKTRDLLEQAVLANGMQNTHRSGFFNFFHPGQTEAGRIARAVQALGSQIQVEVALNTNLIKVSYSSSDPALAYGVLKSLSNLYLEKHAAIHRPPGSNPFLVQQVQSYKAALADAEAGLRAFGQPSGVAEPNKERAEIAQQLTDAVSESHRMEQAIAADEQRIQSDQEQLKGTPQTDRDPAVESLRDNLAKDQADLETQSISLAAGQRGIESMRSQMVKLGSQSLDETDSEREVKAKEQSYLQYLSQREQEHTSGGLGRTRTESVAIASPPEVPARPAHGLPVIFLIALAVAVLVSLSTTYIIDYFDPSFRTPAEVIDILGVGVVVALPKRTA
jgi:uncharacterized protein involved in exopolysaccharide biosynthesis